jgi:hypothetical protein
MNRNTRTTKAFLSITAVLLAAVLLAGCAAKKPVWGDPASGLNLSYRMPEGRSLQYAQSFAHTQNMEVMGTSMKMVTDRTTEFTVLAGGSEESNLRLDVTIDALSISMSGPQGDLSPDLSGVIGKSFEMVLSPHGKEVDVSAAEEIRYELGPAGERNLASDFQTIFPDLADRPVKAGDSWDSTDSITEKSDGTDVRIDLDVTNTLDGFETMDGVECARIVSEFTGAIKGQGNQGGVTLDIAGEISGTDTWLFDYKEGIFVKSTADVHTKATISTGAPQNMTIPMEQDIRVETALVR